jgi:hypothetical protein
MKWCCSRKNGIGAIVIEFLRLISIGKFATKLYYNGKGFKGSVATGILTILITLFLVGYCVLLFWDIVHR